MSSATSTDETTAAEAYEGPGGWGTAAMALLLGLLVVSVIATIHSIVATFGAG